MENIQFKFGIGVFVKWPVSYENCRPSRYQVGVVVDFIRSVCQGGNVYTLYVSPGHYECVMEDCLKPCNPPFGALNPIKEGHRILVSPNYDCKEPEGPQGRVCVINDTQALDDTGVEVWYGSELYFVPHAYTLHLPQEPVFLDANDRWIKDNEEPIPLEDDEPKLNTRGTGPDHYDQHYFGLVEPLELMQAQMTPEAFKGFLRGNIIKYASRLGKKDQEEKEATKILRYAQWLLKVTQGEVVNPRED